MKINLIETHEKTYTSEDIDLSALDPELLEIPSREPLYNGRKDMPGRITRIYLRRTLDFINPERSIRTTVNVMTMRVKKNGDLADYPPEIHRFTRTSVPRARPYWSEVGYTFEALLEALSEQLSEFDKIVSEQ